AVAAATVAAKLAAALIPIPDAYVPYANVIAAVAMLGGGAAAMAVRSPRPRLAYLAVGQLGWVAAGLATHFRSGMAASVFLLGAFAVAATCAPALLGRAEGAAAALPAVTALSTAGAVAFCVVIAAYGAFSYPILGLADQGAEALGLR